MANQNSIRILIVDDHPLVRAGLRALLANDAGLEIIAEASSGEEALAMQKEHGFEVALIDLRLPGMDGFQTLTALLARDRSCRVLVISNFDSEEEVARAIESGAKGYLLKDIAAGELIEAIRTVALGGDYIPEWAKQRIMERNSDTGLSPREAEVLTLIAKGLDNREIGVTLSISLNTVKTFTKRIFTKLGVSGRTEAVTAAIQRGILREDASHKNAELSRSSKEGHFRWILR